MPNFLELIKTGITNFGGNSSVIVKGNTYKLGFKDVLYIGNENTEIIFDNDGTKNPTEFHINSTAKNTNYFTKKASLKKVYKLQSGTMKTASKNLNYGDMQICKITDLR